MESVRHKVAGAMAALLVAFAASAGAQPSRGSALHVEAFDVEQVAGLDAGTRLAFSVFGTPGATAVLRIDGVRRELVLQEVSAGIYELVYTVQAADRIAPDGRVVALLVRGGESARAVLAEPLVLGAASTTVARAAAEPAPPSLPAPVARQSTPVPLAAAREPEPTPPPVERARAEPACADCAVVESIQPVAEGDMPSRVGQRAGGIAGTVFGERIGQLHGRNVTRVLGTLFGRRDAAAGEHDVVLRLADGTTRVRRYESAPPFQVGETIRFGVGVPAADGPRRAD